MMDSAPPGEYRISLSLFFDNLCSAGQTLTKEFEIRETPGSFSPNSLIIMTLPGVTRSQLDSFNAAHQTTVKSAYENIPGGYSIQWDLEIQPLQAEQRVFPVLRHLGGTGEQPFALVDVERRKARRR